MIINRPQLYVPHSNGLKKRWCPDPSISSFTHLVVQINGPPVDKVTVTSYQLPTSSPHTSHLVCSPSYARNQCHCRKIPTCHNASPLVKHLVMVHLLFHLVSCLILKQFEFFSFCLKISNTNRVSKGFLTFGVILCFVSVCFDVVLADLPGSGLHHTRGHHKYHNKSFIKPARGFSC